MLQARFRCKQGCSSYFAFDVSQQIFSFVLLFFAVVWQWLLFLRQPCNSVHVRFVFVVLLILFQLLAYSFRRTRIYIRNLSVRYGLLVIDVYVYPARLKLVSVSYFILYQFPTVADLSVVVTSVLYRLKGLFAYPSCLFNTIFIISEIQPKIAYLPGRTGIQATPRRSDSAQITFET